MDLPSDLLSDAEVVAASLTHPAAFGELFDRHATVLYRYVVRRVDPTDAGALVNEVFLIAFERRANYDTDRPSARPWLYGIATNVVARSREATARRFRGTARAAAQRPDRDQDDPADRATESVHAERTFAGVVEGIQQLPEGERDALVLFAWEGLGYEDIAAALSIPVGTVRSRLNRARRHLRELPAASGEQLVHPDIFTSKKDELMTTITGVEPERFAHQSRMYPRLAYRDELAALGYLTRVFGFTERREARIGSGVGDDHMLAWLEFGAGLVMIGHTNEDIHHIVSPADLGATTTMINVEVDDIDAHYATATREGATITMPIEDAYYGARRYEATDLEGHRWHFDETHDHIRARGGHVPEAPV